MTTELEALRRAWRPSSTGGECTFHQLAPYIGKLKSTVARKLIQAYSTEGDTVLDPFSGSGVVPLEALSLGRGVIANDLSPYAAVLTRAKLYPPRDEATAIKRAARYVGIARQYAADTNFRVAAPAWVRGFFHARTFAEVKALADVLRSKREWFLLACLLGILHHQRPGFLSYPASHLVPYLRTSKFPRSRFPEMYQYRDVEPRLAAKIQRVFRRPVVIDRTLPKSFTCHDIAQLRVANADIAITSPPYMNALDYGRDNRLRLWFCGVPEATYLDSINPSNVPEFEKLLSRLSRLLHEAIRPSGKAILVVGEVRNRSAYVNSGDVTRGVFEKSGFWRIEDETVDAVPDVRRSRRECHSTKREWVFVFRKAH